jgi:putative SOS response-associated peptidase YedK
VVRAKMTIGRCAASQASGQRRPRHEVEADLGQHNVYGFLATAPNAVVEPIHPKAMPVILMTEEERDV